MKKTFRTKALSIFLAVIMAVSGLVPATAAFAGDGVEGYYDLQIFYKDSGTIVPAYQKNEDGSDKVDGKGEKIVWAEEIIEGDELQLTYKLIDSTFPDNGHVKWYSEAPTLVDVDQTGKVKGFDSSKGAVIRLWIDNEVRTIPVVGNKVAEYVEKIFFNQYYDVEKMDTDEIMKIAEAAFGPDSPIGDYVESYSGQLIVSLRNYLDKATTPIHCELYDANGTKVADDVVEFVVRKNEEWYAQFLPNGTHITNKSQIETTQAKKSTVQLYAITTPRRLNLGTVYSVKSSSILSQGKVVATVTDGGLVTFRNVGTTTILASPDTKDFIEALLKFVNYFYALENTGLLDTNKAADILIKYIGIDINRAVLAGILDVAFAIYKIAGDAADPVQLTATAVEILANLTLQFIYNDTIDFTCVEAQPIQDFKINGAKSVKEGVQTQLSIEDVTPSFGDKTDIVWRSSNPSIACIEPDTGIITALDAGGSLGALSSQTCTIYATSTTNNIERSFELTVTGKTGKYISKVDINGNSIVDIKGSEDFSYSIYPKRVAESENLYITWGLVGPEDEDGNPTYIWADGDNVAVDPHGVAKIDSRGHFTPLTGGRCEIALHAKTGYLLSDGSFYEISSYIATKEVETGIPVKDIHIAVTQSLGNGGSLGRNEKVTIAGTDYYYCTEKIGVGNMYYLHGASLAATVSPSNATNQDITWVIDNQDFVGTMTTESTHSIDVKRVAGKEYTDTFNIYAVSNDGEVVSNIVTVCVTRNYASSNKINEKKIEMINGKSGQASHTMTFEGSWDSGAYACYDANWYSSDESIFTVKNKGNDNSDAVLEAHDVGTATLYCVSADGAFIDTAEVVVKPDKQRLQELVDICDKTIVLMTKFNKDYYKNYIKKLDRAYFVLYEQDMASQSAVDTAADDLLVAFTKVGGFVGITGLEVTGANKEPLSSDYITVVVGSTKNYKNYSYDFDYEVAPKGAMYSKAVWTSSNGSIKVDENGVCVPTSNDPCAADITCTITDYNGAEVKKVKHIAFVKTKATGVELNVERIDGALIGKQQQLTATILPKNVFGNSTASVKDVTWFSTNEKVVSVNKDGLLTFNYGGDAYIICTTADGGFQYELPVNVVTNYDNLSLLVKQYNDLLLNESSYYPETWEPYITAKTEAENMIRKKGYSQEAVDAQYVKLEKAYKNLRKFVDIQKVELYLDGEPTAEFYQYDLRLLKEGISYKNAKLDLNVRLYPNNATYQSATWSSSTSDISVTSDGVCSPTVNKSCYGEITCTVVDSFGNEYSDTVYVSYSYNPVTAVRLSQDNITGAIGTDYQLTCTIEPTGSSLLHIASADIKDYFWESDDPSVATVDKNGLVKFVGAGSTIVRCVSYDGGVNGQCKVSSEGDRTELKAAIEKYDNIDYTKYEYTYGIAFKTAYENAVSVLGDKSKTQDEIDIATSNLNVAAEALPEHPYRAVESIKVTYTTQKRSLTNSATTVSSGTVSSSNALQVNLSSSYSNYNDYNDVILKAFNEPSNSMFKAVKWEIVQNNGMYIVTNSLANLTVHPDDSHRSSNASALVRAVYTDHYGQDATREIWITMSDTVCTGINVTEKTLNLKGSDAPVQLHWTTNGATGHDSTVMFESTNKDIATVSSDGKVTIVDAGECQIMVKTRDGGYTAYVNVRITTDFSKLVNKVNECEKLINDVKDTDQYTEDSLNRLSAEVEASRAIINDNSATQREVNEALKKLNAAYDSLSGYIPATGIELKLQDTQAAVSEVNPGFIRYKGNSLNGATVQLAYDIKPADGMFEEITWTSSSSNITVNEEGLVENTVLTPGAAEITATVTTVYGDRYSDSIYVSFVRYPVTGISFGTSLVYGASTKTKQIPVIVSTEKQTDISVGELEAAASIQQCLYESLDETIATVDGEGNVTFRTIGKTSVKVTSIDGGYVAYIPVQTTNDTSALEEAVLQAEAVDYMDYEYLYGMKLKADREAGRALLDNPNASQDDINAACKKLEETFNTAQEHPFVVPVVTMKAGETVVTNGAVIKATDGVLNIDVSVASNMYQSYSVATSNEKNCTADAGIKGITITKTGDKDATLTLEAMVVDMYGRETAYIYNITVVDEIINVETVEITLNGEVVTSVTRAGYSSLYRDFEPFTLGYKVQPESVSSIKKIEWSSTNANYITVDQNGVVDLTSLAKAKQTNTTNIICTVTNQDGSTVTAKIPVTISR